MLRLGRGVGYSVLGVGTEGEDNASLLQCDSGDADVGLKGEFEGVLAQGTITAANLKASDCAGCNGMTFAQLISAMKAGNAFVNVHTTQNPGGEIQGTITE